MLPALTALTFLRFVVPADKTTADWNNYNTELNNLLQPIHQDLAHDFISPDVAGDRIGETIKSFLLSKPEFHEDKQSSSFIQHKSKTLEKAKSAKNELRKAARKSNDPGERKQFFKAIRVHSYLNKLQKQKDKTKTAAYQEKLFKQNFFSFSKSVCDDTFGDSAKHPSFSKETADDFYPNRYSKCEPLNLNNLNWFPTINSRQFSSDFNLKPFKPKDIRKIIKSKSSSSSPGPDGVTYGLLKKLPCVHKILATLYSKLLVTPKPPSSWSTSRITLIHKKDDTDIPSNFRMIALSSVLGKVYHLLISQRLCEYVTKNNLIDSTVQKAFIQKVNGVIEHNMTLQEIIKNARTEKKTSHCTFFDLEDAFGSVHHSLISHCLNRFKVPTQIHDYIMNLYSTLNGTVTTKEWSSKSFRFRKGVFQGDPLSPIIFLIVFNPILERLNQELKFGYQLKNIQIITTPFADDFNIITTNRRTHQRIINEINSCCKSMGLKLKPSKCRSLSIVSGSSEEIFFEIDGNKVETLTSKHHKFLGSTISFTGKQRDILEVVEEHFLSKLQNIDKLAVRDEYKVKIYSDYLLPSSRFILTVHNLTSSSLDHLDAVTRRFLKKWLHLPPCATVPILHSKEILNIKSIRHLYQESHACSYISTRLKGDEKVNIALDSQLEREETWVRKQSTIVDSENIRQRVGTEELQSAKKNTKKIIEDEFQQQWNNHIKSLSLQGRFLELLNESENNVSWKSVLYHLPRNVLQFFINSSIDTLPTNTNLTRWHKRSSPNCGLCNGKETLLHTFNYCPTMLSQDRYTWRHNSIVNKLQLSLRNTLPASFKIFSDIPGYKNGISTIPTDILITSLKPDIVVANYEEKEISLIEITVPFDSNINDANERKCKRYENLVHDLGSTGFKTNMAAIEISSRGLITKDNKARLKHLFSLRDSISKKTFNELLTSLQKIAIVCSYIIFHSKYDNAWIEPEYVFF